VIEGRTIVCFASSWYIDPTSKHHVMRLLSEKNRVVWINYHASRRPTVSRKDFGVIFQKIAQARKGPDRISDSMKVITPLLVPLPGFPGVKTVNRAILLRQIRRAMKEWGDRPVQLWTFAPDVAFMAGRLGEEALVYYCVDEFSEFEGYDRELVKRQEAELIGKADVVFTTARALQESKAPMHPRTHLIPHGVDYDHFASAMRDDLPLPDELRDLSRPIAGFFGLIQEWVDVDLLERLARAHPDWSVVLIGDARTDVSRLKALPNVKLLGRRPYEALPAFARRFDVALIPFRINELTRNVNPIKLREYLAAGCPVVSTPLPEVQLYAGHVSIAEGDGFVEACGRGVADDSPEQRRARCDAMRAESWPAKIEELSRHVEAARAARTDPAAGRSGRP